MMHEVFTELHKFGLVTPKQFQCN